MINLISQFQTQKWMLTSPAFNDLMANVAMKLTHPELSTKQASINQVSQDDFKVDSNQMPDSMVALVYVNGILVKAASPEQEEELGLSNTDTIAQAIDDANADPTISEICLIFNSPGGSVTGIEELGRKIAQSPKPIKGWSETKSCSAAYWLMSQCSLLGCTPSANIGSVGVMLVLDDLTKAMEMAGIKKEAFNSGEYKLMGQPFKPISDKEREILQQGVVTTHEQFKQTVLSKRQVDAKCMEGLIYEGIKAKEANLVDVVTDTLSQFLTTSNYKPINNMNIVTKITKPVEAASAVAPVIEKQAAVPGVPGTEADTANGVPANPIRYTVPNHATESGHYGGGYIACPGCKLEFKMEDRHVAAGPAPRQASGEQEPPDKPEDKPTAPDKSEIEEDKKDEQKTEKPNEKMEDKEKEKEAKTFSFNDWRAQALGIKPKKASSFHQALNEYVKTGGTKVF